MKIEVYVSAFIFQILALFCANYLAGMSWALFFAPVLLAALLAAILYHRVKIRTMWSYLGMNFAASIFYFEMNHMIRYRTQTDALLPPNDAQPLLVIAMILMTLLAAIPVVPVCLYYRSAITKKMR